jgi:hypothetical protein
VAAALAAPVTTGCITPCDAGWTSTSVQRGIEDRTIARKFPHQGAPSCHPPDIGLLTHGTATCVAILLDARTVLTAAHCVERAPDGEAFYRVGTSARDALGARCVHPDYSAACTGAYDLAVARLEAPVEGGAVAAVHLMALDEAGAAQGVTPSSVGVGRWHNVFDDDATVRIYGATRFRAAVASNFRQRAHCYGAVVGTVESSHGGSIERIDVVDEFIGGLVTLPWATWSGAPVFVETKGADGEPAPGLIGVVSHTRLEEKLGVVAQGLSVQRVWVQAAAEALAAEGPLRCPNNLGRDSRRQAK